MKHFTEAKKRRVLAAVEGGMTIKDAAKQFECSNASIMAWRKKAKASDKAVDFFSPMELPTVQQALRAEKMLTLENAYLKARIAYLEARL